MIEDLNDDNFLIYTLKCYNTPNCIMSEFESDMKRLKYLKKHFRKYSKKGVLKERLILNHIIMLNNVFGPECTSRILFFKMDEDDYSVLKTFLLYVNLMPISITINGKTINSSDIMIDMNVAKILRTL